MRSPRAAAQQPSRLVGIEGTCAKQTDGLQVPVRLHAANCNCGKSSGPPAKNPDSSERSKTDSKAHSEGLDAAHASTASRHRILGARAAEAETVKHRDSQAQRQSRMCNARFSTSRCWGRRL